MAATAPHRSASRGPIGAVFSPLVLAVDWLRDYWTHWVHLRAKGYILAFDGTYVDLLVDRKGRQYGGGSRLARALWWLLPKPDLVFVLDAEPVVLCQRPAVHVLKGNAPMRVLIDDVQRHIRAWIVDRSRTSMRGTQAPLNTAPTARTEDSRGAPTL